VIAWTVCAQKKKIAPTVIPIQNPFEVKMSVYLAIFLMVFIRVMSLRARISDLRTRVRCV